MGVGLSGLLGQGVGLSGLLRAEYWAEWSTGGWVLG